MSDEMICVISPSTLLSQWVPFEIGYAFQKLNITMLTLQGVATLPQYVHAAGRVILGLESMDQYVRELTAPFRPLVEHREIYSEKLYLLENIMDKNR